MRAAVINGAVVENIIVVDSLDSIPGLQLMNADGAKIGDLVQDGKFVTPEIPVDTGTFNASIYKLLEEIDTKSIRALREGDEVRISSLESEASMLRSQLKT